MENAVSPPTKMDLASTNVNEDRLAALRALVPEAFTEGRIDWGKLRLTLGDAVDEGRERYGLSWPGKADAMRIVQVPSTGTVVPDRAASVNFDTTTNLMIEGDNLEVLKLLQKSYHGKVKMIYIDPPYNTGSEFIYPDNFREGLQDYLRYSGQVDGEGIKLSTNTESNGRYHSKWLSMMYPRLFLARNLLRDDGVIFVSIDDHEVHNLRHLMDEIFGPENFVAAVAWQRRDTPANDTSGFSVVHEYLVSYARDIAGLSPSLLPRTADQLANYKNPDQDPRGPWTRGAMTRPEYQVSGDYAVTNPKGRQIRPTASTSWRVSPSTYARLSADNRIWWGASDDGDMPFQKRFLSEVRQGVSPTTWWDYKAGGSTRNAKAELRALFGEDVPFEFPKPTRLVMRLVSLFTTPNEADVVLDFFAGSGTTGEAVWRVNQQDGGDRRFVLVQLPEPTGRRDYATIAEVTKARLRKSALDLANKAKGKLEFKGSGDQDRGFRAFRLTSSNFREWADALGAGALEAQLRLHTNHLLPDRDAEAVLWELALKSGKELSSRVEMLEVAGEKIYVFQEGPLFVCLGDPIRQEVLRGMADRGPERVICLDHAFRGDDQLLTNTVLEMKSHGVKHFRTV